MFIANLLRSVPLIQTLVSCNHSRNQLKNVGRPDGLYSLPSHLESRPAQMQQQLAAAEAASVAAAAAKEREARRKAPPSHMLRGARLAMPAGGLAHAGSGGPLPGEGAKADDAGAAGCASCSSAGRLALLQLLWSTDKQCISRRVFWCGVLCLT